MAERRIPRAIIGAVIAVVLCAFGVVQIGSDALYARAAEPGSLPTRIPLRTGLAVYRLLDRIAPAAYVEDTLGNEALAHGELARAQRYALRMPASSRRNDLLARIALARGQHVLAQEYFFVAPDVDAMEREIRRLSARDPARAYDLQRRFVARLRTLGTHPDAVAEGYWHAGIIAEQLGRPQDALAQYERAMHLAPLNAKYVLAAANQAFSMHDDAAAEPLYRHALDVAPGSANAIAGLGIMALHRGDRATALADAARARALNPNAGMLHELERELQ